MARDYIPRTDAEFDEWLENFKNQAPAIAVLLMIPPIFVNEVDRTYNEWDVAFDAHQVAKNAAQAASETKDDARAAALTAARDLAGMFQKHPNTSDAQRETLGLTVPDRKPTPTAPDYVMNFAPPLLLLDWSKRGQVTVHFGVNPSNEKLNAKPEDIAGAKLWYRIGVGAWQFLADDTNSPYTHNFQPTDATNLEYRAQWFDKKLRSGPFSDPANCTVTP